MALMRARILVTKVEPFMDMVPNFEEVRGIAISDDDENYPRKGRKRKAPTFSEYNPRARVKLTVTNESLFGKIKSGDILNLTFEKEG